ncbi:MAG: hypothetical protein F6K56_34425, partial [Moorea sp. SIO3G5]|nr:hypothetical protein [Moorena sp. SIO3G5]
SPHPPNSLLPTPYSLLPTGASPKSCLTRWCVTGRTVLTLGSEKMRASPSLTHPTPYSLLPTPYSLLPTPYSLLPTPINPERFHPI